MTPSDSVVRPRFIFLFDTEDGRTVQLLDEAIEQLRDPQQREAMRASQQHAERVGEQLLELFAQLDPEERERQLTEVARVYKDAWGLQVNVKETLRLAEVTLEARSLFTPSKP